MKLLYPLDWPVDQERTLGPVGWPPAGCKVDGMREPAERLAKALNLPAFGDVSLSANVPIGPTGLYLANAARSDAGAALRFTFKGRGYHVGQDGWSRVYFNVWSLALMAEGLRQTVRHAGDALFQRMISGFAALPAPGGGVPALRAPHEVLGVAPNAPRSVVEAAYRALARSAHPDAGGSAATMAALTAARDSLLSADPSQQSRRSA